jgi:VIT1/CCC1 family predicted Fe2+/Mn2+ transporter
MFFILPTVLLLISLIAAFMKGKVLGLVSVVVAYCSGVLIFISAVLSIMLLLLAVALGFLATNRRLLKKVKL